MENLDNLIKDQTASRAMQKADSVEFDVSKLYKKVSSDISGISGALSQKADAAATNAAIANLNTAVSAADARVGLAENAANALQNSKYNKTGGELTGNINISKTSPIIVFDDINPPGTYNAETTLSNSNGTFSIALRGTRQNTDGAYAGFDVSLRNRYIKLYGSDAAGAEMPIYVNDKELAYANDFKVSPRAAGQGYIKLLGGVIIQWARFNGAGTSAGSAVTFPLSAVAGGFTQAPHVVFTDVTGTDDTSVRAAKIVNGTLNANGFTAITTTAANGSSGYINDQFNYIAIGF